tara:strand:- start:269 stop:994 length:726 start_codon:yes stop_codon:yes gene_type:complete
MSRQLVLDTETTGIDFKSGHRVIEIGCIEIVNRKFTGVEYQTYLNPDREIDEGAFKVHGLTFDFLQDKPRFVDIAEEFLKFIRGGELLIHNAEFDLGFLNNELKLIPGKESRIEDVTDKITDTLQIAREKHPGQRNSLDALVQRYAVEGYDREYHGALLDSKILGDVYLAMTGGQSDLLFESNSSQFSQELKESKRKVVSPNEKSKTPLIQLTEAEEKENLDYLNKMKEETGVQPIWLKKE